MSGTSTKELRRETAANALLATPDPRRMSTRELLARIVDQQHGSLRAVLPTLGSCADKVARVHRLRSPNLTTLAATIHELIEVLTPHLDHEEQTLFPALAQGCAISSLIAHELRDTQRDHAQLETLLEQIREASGRFAVPEWGCRSYRALADDLAGLDGALRSRLHLEDHVLLPRFLGPAK